MADLPQVESVQVLRLQPGDVIVATIPDGTSMATVHDIGGQLRTYFEGHKVLMVTKGLSLDVARQYDGPETCQVLSGIPGKCRSLECGLPLPCPEHSPAITTVSSKMSLAEQILRKILTDGEGFFALERGVIDVIIDLTNEEIAYCRTLQQSDDHE